MHVLVALVARVQCVEIDTERNRAHHADAGEAVLPADGARDGCKEWDS